MLFVSEIFRYISNILLSFFNKKKTTLHYFQISLTKQKEENEIEELQ